MKVLAVDDEPDVLYLLEVKLKKAGYEVLTAPDGEAGLHLALREKPDAVILDIMMPKLDGYAVTERIKKEMVPPPVVSILTARGQEADIVRGIREGADDYIIKPFAPRELLERLNVALIKAGKIVDKPQA